jgi:hypothetical protein
MRCGMGISRALACAALVWPLRLAAAEIPRTTPPALRRTSFPAASDLDGTHVWLGPTGVAGRIDATWDSAFGAQLALLRVRERAAIGAVGVAIGASRWTERGGGRVGADAVIGTTVGGRMVGLTVGPILELSDLARPRLGAAAGAWAFTGITPFVRAGAVSELGGFVEIGVFFALPVWRVVDNRAPAS